MKFEWDDKCQSSFEQLKKIMVEAPVLTHPTSGREYATCMMLQGLVWDVY